jgi:DNA-binding SARP family transcriptional activator
MKNELIYQKLIFLFLLISAYVLESYSVSSQTYGLKFNSSDYTIENRTELNLTPDDYLKFRDEFEISFDYKATRLVPNSGIGLFGYVFRIINDQDHNIDLLSTPTPVIGLNMVLGRSNTIIPIDYPAESIDNWIKIRVKFLLAEDRLIVYTPDTFYVQEKVGLKKLESFRIIFGVNDFKQFKNSDVPSMSVKNIELFEKGKPKYHWVLDEKEGSWAVDRIRGKKARVTNPSWLSLNHQNWQKKIVHKLKGSVSVTADTLNGKIFMVGENELTTFSVQNNTLQKQEYKFDSLFLNDQYRVIFNSTDKKIYAYLAVYGPCYRLDTETGEWSEFIPAGKIQPYFRHHNTYFHGVSDNIYLFGGYGMHKYNNTIFRIDLKERKWIKMPTSDSVYYPRYLAGLGALNDTIYILGGFGSKSGNQMVNPQSFFDIIGYSVRDNTLFAKYEIPHLVDDMIVGNSLYIDGGTRDYYALIFNKQVFNVNLQLIQGNLDLPEVKMVGDKIPARFLDIRSFVNLFYMPVQHKLYTYMSYSNDSITEVEIYSIDYPPQNSVSETGSNKNNNLLFYLAISALLLSGIYFINRRLHKKRGVNIKDAEIPLSEVDNMVNENGLSDTGKSPDQIIFFGGFQIFNKDYKDITSQFTPLLKELFLLIFLYSFKNNKGISSEKLTELLWFDKSEKSARNNRAVNIAKLRTILEETGICDLSKKTGYWKIIFTGSDIRIDYVDFLNITSSVSTPSRQDIRRFIDITGKGSFLSDLNYEWLDDFKALVSDKVIDTLYKFGLSVDVKKEPEFIIELADSILNFDMVNEEAMILKCQAEYYMGNYSLAKATYENFFKKYLVMYGQEYDRTFLEILDDRKD